MLWWNVFWKNTITPLMKKLNRSGFGLSILPIVILIGIGTIAYAYFEGWSLPDSLYATIITITTVGYGDLSPQTVGGRLFAIFFTLSAIGLASYAISTLAAGVIRWEQERVQRHIQEQRMSTIASLENHIIVCGGNAISRKAMFFFQRDNQPIILVEQDEEKLRRALLYLDIEYLQKKFGHYYDLTQAVDVTEDEQLSLEELTERVDVPYLLADPTDDSTLIAAGIDRARGIVAALDSDEHNLFAVISARALATQMDNPKLRILALVYDDKNGPKLQIAGADQLIFPEKGSGMQVQSWMMNPLIGDFWMEVSFKAQSTYDMQQFIISDYPAWVGKSVTQLRNQHQVVVLAVWRDGAFHYSPTADEVLQANDVLIAFAPKMDQQSDGK
ncbi:potassium channel family protein [Candidatus Leptofilum sp.]|uniref:potassium channel family protein n=1 Tax=Candidatus Leptofilum sp. TaxID=3241576 RepID=UPI003B5C4BA8